MSHTKILKVAAVQAAPVFLDRKATVEKACELIAEAGKRKVSLVVFPEAFIPAYSDWVWVVPAGKKALLNDLYAELIENAVTIPDDSTKRICSAARKSKTHVVIGVNELNAESSSASLYNSIIYIDSSGNIMGKHRKLVPTGGICAAASPGATVLPLGSSGAVPAIAITLPMRTAREMPRIGS